MALWHTAAARQGSLASFATVSRPSPRWQAPKRAVLPATLRGGSVRPNQVGPAFWEPEHAAGYAPAPRAVKEDTSSESNGLMTKFASFAQSMGVAIGGDTNRPSGAAGPVVSTFGSSSSLGA